MQLRGGRGGDHGGEGVPAIERHHPRRIVQRGIFQGEEGALRLP